MCTLSYVDNVVLMSEDENVIKSMREFSLMRIKCEGEHDNETEIEKREIVREIL